MMPTVWRVLVTCAVIAIASWLHVIQLVEAYGSGPPYYSLTTNMDKWGSPIPFLIGVNGTALTVLAFVWGPPILRARRSRRRGMP